MPFDHFDLLAKIYDRAAPYSLTETDTLFLALPSEGRMLDLGGGTGRVAVTLQDLVGYIVLADLSRGMLSRALSKGLPVACAPAENLPFPSDSFSRVILRDAFHHLTDHKKASRELWRILVPGGRIVIIEPDILRPTVKALAVIEKLLLMRSHFFTAERIVSHFDYPEARSSIHREAGGVWIVIKKVR